ncbi:MAG: hypothetical protein ABUL53_03150 [Bradyrhizobium guangdongense]
MADSVGAALLVVLETLAPAERLAFVLHDMFAVAAWREAPYFTESERAALALTEALTRISDREEPVSDAVWGEADKQFDEQELAALILAIANINVWNRLNVAVRQPAGVWKG